MPHYDKNNSYMTTFQNLPPSRLGFVCKPDMPPHINILFRARPPLEFTPLPYEGKSRPYEGIFGYTPNILDLFQKGAPEKYKPDESKRILRLKSIIENCEKNKAENKEKLKEWNPKNDANIQGDPYKTLFIYKLDYKTDERKLKREFEMYGPIKRVKVVRDLEGNSRGYAFIEFEHKSDFKNAYKKADRKRIDENRVSVDYERGRTEKNWKPRRFGGGKGECRVVPAWLEKELNMVKEYYPELMTNYKSFSSAPEETPRKRSRSRNRSQENDKEKESKGINVNDENFQNTSCSFIENMNVNMTRHVELVDSGNFESSITQNMEVDQIQRMNGVSITRDHSNEDHKKHKKDKKEKRDKKEKKEKKEKKSKKDKKERKEKRSDKELEVGEIA